MGKLHFRGFLHVAALIVPLLGLVFVSHRNPAASFAQPAPTAHQLAFVSDRDRSAQIYVMNADGSGQTRLTGPEENAIAPAWAPTGQRLAYVLFDQGPPQIYMMNPDGSGKVRLTSQGGNIFPAWSPDGQQIAFASNRDGGLHIYVMNADGSNQRRVTTGAWEFVASPAWSPDGTRLAFTGQRGPTDDPGTFIINADGSGESRLGTAAIFRRGFMEPVWAPDGKLVLFVGIPPTGDGSSILYVSSLDGGSPKMLADGYAPTWSPDGRRIAFACCFPGGPGETIQLRIMNADGTGRTQLTTGPSGNTFPAWSPDGSRIAYACCWPGQLAIFTVNPDGIGVQRLTVAVTPANLGPGGGFGPILTWRPIRP